MQKEQQSVEAPPLASFPLSAYETQIVFRSDFDSGNAKLVKRVSDFQYRLQCIDDGTKTGHAVNSRSWFYFSVSGYPQNIKGRFIVSKVQALMSIYYSKYARYYRPVFRVQGQQWERLPQQAQLYLTQSGQIECTIEYTFKQEKQTVQFAFCYPYQFEKQMQFLENIEHFNEDEEIYYRKEVLIQSPQKRPVHLLTITNQQKAGKDDQNELLFDCNLFPEKQRPLKFKKPVVLITARVHPGETPASYAMQGVINFLLNKEDLRAHMLRSMFVFMIVPMINVDGVYHGHFRMDIYGKNLNRFYIQPDLKLQPAIYGIKQLAKHLIAANRLSFYFDLHGHNTKKGCFIYGNAFSDFVEQVQSQVFCKLFSMNHSGFEYEYCNFSQKHMNAKDRFEDLTKEGCGRVVMHKEANIIHSYSLQCGIISANASNTIPEPTNTEFKVQNKGFVKQDIEQSDYQGTRMADNSLLFTQDSYRNLGKNLLVSILDVFDKNPYNRVYNSRYKSMEMLRRITAFQIFHSSDRFRMYERSVFGKVKNINTLISDILNSKTQYKQLYNCLFADNEELCSVEWPKNTLGLQRQVKIQLSKMKKYKSISQNKSVPVAYMVQSQPKSRESVLIVDKFQEQDNRLSEALDIQTQDIKIDRTSTLQVKESLQDPISGKEEEERPYFKANSALIIKNQDQEAIQSDSDQSEVKDLQVNQQILLMCENQKQQNEIISKIMHDNFNEKDYQEIQEKYKHKNHLEISKEERKSNISDPRTEVKKINHNECMRHFKSSKDPKYRLNRKVIVNTCDVSGKYKKKLQILENNDSVKNNLEPQEQQASLKKLTAAQQFRKNIYDAIKQEIKDGLRRQYDRKKQKQRIDNKLVDSFRMKQNVRVRSNQNYLDAKRMKSKVRLPSLGANMYIITTSTRVLHKN